MGIPGLRWLFGKKKAEPKAEPKPKPGDVDYEGSETTPSPKKKKKKGGTPKPPRTIREYKERQKRIAEELDKS